MAMPWNLVTISAFTLLRGEYMRTFVVRQHSEFLGASASRTTCAFVKQKSEEKKM